MAAASSHLHASGPETERALDSGAVVRWWQITTFVSVTGPDALTLLDGLCTQAVQRIEPGTARLGLFLDAKAQIIAPAVLHRIPHAPWVDARGANDAIDAPFLLLETLPDLVEPLVRHLRRYRLRAKVDIEPAQLSSIALIGAAAHDVAASAPGTWTMRSDEQAPAATLLGDAGECATYVAQVPALEDVVLADPDALEAARIARGDVSLHDLLAGRMPAEVGGMVAVALDAGCYLGQEPVARLHYRGRARRSLRRLTADAPLQPRAPDTDGIAAALQLHDVHAASGARPAGQLTTWAQRPDGMTVAIAMLRTELKAGAELRLDGTDHVLQITDDPPS